jgi:ferredoxin-like protein FixX
MAQATGSGMFIRVEVDDPAASDAETAKKLAGVCPVDIFAERGGKVAIIDENLDECILCALCLAVPGVRVVKIYDNDAVLVAP